MTSRREKSMEADDGNATESGRMPHDKRLRQRGAALLYAIGALLVMGSLAGGLALLTPSSTMTEQAENRHMRAYYLALTGLGFCQQIAKSLSSTTPSVTLSLGQDVITISYSGSVISGFTVTSKGTVNSGTPLEANYILSHHFSSNPGGGDDSGASPITLDSTGWSTTHPENVGYAITVFSKNQPSTPKGYDATTWAAEYAAYINKYGGSTWVRLADDMTDSNGALWYTGYRGFCPGGICPTGACYKGKCGLGNGLRAVFSFKFNDLDTSSDSRDAADVMTFAIMTGATGTNDPATASGGPTATQASLGEYLGYAGLGINGVGIKPPKIGVEVDTYPNGNSNVYDRYGNPQAGSRNDYDTNNRVANDMNNHVAVVFWGSRTNDPDLADDNRHGAGDGVNDPINPTYNSRKTSGSGCGLYRRGKVGSYQWLEDGQIHTMRVEVLRSTNSSTNVGTYEIKTWVVDGQPASTDAFMDVTANYTGSTYSALLDYPVTLKATDNTALNQIYVGWTEGTGGATQNADIFGFSMEFIQ